MRQESQAHGNRDGGRKRPPGRPRSEQARLAILRSTLKLLGENGFSDLTIEAVAAHAGVGKATVYRWWPNKAALIADAFASSTSRKLHFPDTGSVYTDMSRQMRQVVEDLSQPAWTHCFRHARRRAERPRPHCRFPRALPLAAPPRSLCHPASAEFNAANYARTWTWICFLIRSTDPSTCDSSFDMTS